MLRTGKGILSALAAVLLLTALTSGTASAISHGDVVDEPDPYPFVGMVTYTDPSRLHNLCTATLIDPSWALTAGHCLRDDHDRDIRPDLVHLTFGFTRLDGQGDPMGGTRRSGSAVRYGDTGLGLVKLDAPITDVTPVPLADPAQSVLWKEHSRAQIVGWGSLNMKGTVPTHELREGWQEVTDSNVTVLGPDRNMIKTRTPSAKGFGKAAPEAGDSGSPLLAYKDGPVQIGVFDATKTFYGRARIGSYYDAVGRTMFHDWIERQIAQG